MDVLAAAACDLLSDFGDIRDTSATTTDMTVRGNTELMAAGDQSMQGDEDEVGDQLSQSDEDEEETPTKRQKRSRPDPKKVGIIILGRADLTSVAHNLTFQQKKDITAAMKVHSDTRGYTLLKCHQHENANRDPCPVIMWALETTDLCIDCGDYDKRRFTVAVAGTHYSNPVTKSYGIHINVRHEVSSNQHTMSVGVNGSKLVVMIFCTGNENGEVGCQGKGYSRRIAGGNGRRKKEIQR
jgi:hypothetical protein